MPRSIYCLIVACINPLRTDRVSWLVPWPIFGDHTVCRLDVVVFGSRPSKLSLLACSSEHTNVNAAFTFTWDQTESLILTNISANTTAATLLIPNSGNGVKRRSRRAAVVSTVPYANGITGEAASEAPDSQHRGLGGTSDSGMIINPPSYLFFSFRSHVALHGFPIR